MPAVIFLLMFCSLLVFIDRMSGKFPEEMKELYSRIIGLIPVFEGENSSIMQFAFAIVAFAFVIILVLSF